LRGVLQVPQHEFEVKGRRIKVGVGVKAREETNVSKLGAEGYARVLDCDLYHHQRSKSRDKRDLSHHRSQLRNVAHEQVSQNHLTLPTFNLGYQTFSLIS
jgi:hypothetical protein